VLSLAVNGGDVAVTEEGLQFRVGFDVSDRAVYMTWADELNRSRPPRTEDPLFAGLPTAYSYFAPAVGLLLADVVGLPLLGLEMLYAPALALAFTALALDALLAELGVVSRLARGVSLLLVMLGGDLSFLFPSPTSVPLERTRHFLVFHSFSAEALFYNSWGWGIPLALAALALALPWLRDGSRGALVLSAFVTGGLWQTKIFAFLPLVAAMALAGLVARRARPAILAATSGLMGLPYMCLSLATGARQGPPLLWGPLHHVAVSLETNPTLQDWMTGLLQWGLPAPLCWMAVTVVFVAGGLGMRCLGLRRLADDCRRDATGFHLGMACLFVVTLGGSLIAVGNPVAINGAQMLVLLHSLSWLYAASVLADALRAPSRARRAGAALVLAAAVVSPLGYIARKRFPAAFTAPDSLDRRSQTISPDSLAACRWLARNAAPADRLVMSLWGDPGDRGGLKPLYVAALSRRRIVTLAAPLNVDPRLVRERLMHVERLYAAASVSEGEQSLRALGARWVWEEAVPLPFRFPSLRLRFRQGDVALYEFSPSPSPATAR